MQKLARDQVRVFTQFKSNQPLPAGQEKEAQLCKRLHEAGKDKWDENWAIVYELSDTIQARIISEWTGRSIARRAAL
jgi:hypothetical protein